MKQLFQNLKNGETILEDVPTPVVQPGFVLIRTHCSLISLGTERMLVEFGKAGLLDKARQQPEKVKQVLDKIRTDGLMPTVKAVSSKLDAPLPLGYCNAGEVVAVGVGVTHVAVGDRVVSNGPHAEAVLVPGNLVARVPENVTDEQAAFTVLASIGLQGLRLAQPTLGETCVVYGLGLVGQLTARLARAAGCRVIGLDLDPAKIALAEQAGVVGVPGTAEPVEAVMELTGGAGADMVLITASAKGDTIAANSARMSRKRGRLVLVGVVDLQLNRADFYEKELTFQVSCSYGPGRYDPEYEEKGRDYPAAFVRWTEQRNFEAILDCLAQGSLSVDELISERVAFSDAPEVYATLAESRSIATLLQYDTSAALESCVEVKPAAHHVGGEARIAVVGTGNFTRATMLPLLRDAGAHIEYLCSRSGASAALLAKKAGAAKVTTDFEAVLRDEAVRAVIIATRHNLHASQCVQALEAGKHVFVEKPLAMNLEELRAVGAALDVAGERGSVMVGFNRRFAPHTRRAAELIGGRPANVVITANAGALPATHWTQDPEIGGGRVIGEACHFIDLFACLAGAPIESVCASSLGTDPNPLSDNVTIQLKAVNGSQGVVNYFANGNKGYPKERVEVFAEGRVLVIDNFRVMHAHGVPGRRKSALRGQDKGHAAQFSEYVTFLRTGGQPPLSWKAIENTTAATLAVLESLRTKRPISIAEMMREPAADA